MWVEFVVGSLLSSKRIFSGYSSFPVSSKTSTSKFQFNLDYCQALYHKPLARVIAQALPVFDFKFTIIITFFLPLNPESSVLTMRPPQLPLSKDDQVIIIVTDPTSQGH